MEHGVLGSSVIAAVIFGSVMVGSSFCDGNLLVAGAVIIGAVMVGSSLLVAVCWWQVL